MDEVTGIEVTLPCRPGGIENATYFYDPEYPMIAFQGNRTGVCPGCEKWKNVPNAKTKRMFVEANMNRTTIKDCS